MDIFIAVGRGNRVYENADLDAYTEDNPHVPSTSADRLQHYGNLTCNRTDVYDEIKDLKGRQLPLLVLGTSDPKINTSLNCLYVDGTSLKLIPPTT